MYLYGKLNEIIEATGSERLASLGIKPVSDLEELITMLAESSNDEPLVIVDTGKEIDFLLTLALVKKLRKGGHVYVLSRRKKESDFILGVFRAGADDIFFYQRPDEAETCLSAIYQGLKGHLSKSVAFMGSGGTGATFLVINVAYTLKRLYENLRICIIDCDCYKNDAAIRMGIDDTRKLLTVQDLITEIYGGENVDLNSLLIGNRAAGITIIPTTEWGMYTPKFSEEEYIKVLSYISMQHDITIFNLGESLAETFLPVLTFSDRIYVVVAQEMVPMKVSISLLNLLKRLGKEKDTELIANRFRKEHSLNTLESVYGRKISFTIPDEYKMVSKLEFERRPVTAGDSHAFAAGVESVAKNIIKAFVRE
ncbi:MAG: AAA family ATPase [Deltaproteobacteria bacterium]|nr:AAA family ATPase [Deltaproteobacteria bacterium]